MMEKLPDILTDGDLRLRPLTAADLTVVTAHFNDIRITRWLAAVAQPFGPEAARELLAHGTYPGENLRVIEHHDRIVGGLCVGTSLWYWLAPEFWRQGLMRRALKLIITARFIGAAPPLTATAHVENTASRELLTGLGFSIFPAPRRMFFHSTQTSESCRDYVMAPEQWHLLHPLTFRAGNLSFRPARQQDTPALAQMLSTAGPGPWPETESLTGFIEEHRYRGSGQGLFVMSDDNRRNVGMALLTITGPQLCFLSEVEDIRHRVQVMDGLASILHTWS
ncbi:hypothetical protein MACH17_14550 [Phaeobacter inhibens]|uniref:GNAT family N-acetyltransferase n=1 Tax=Phaeobacter inhibens TaxID=221822 RepID=UPI002750B05E|nr:GNAT family N-acetyltransferase [Phaeobacter inhibens]GLO69938.1 hypothetical protein MACH17_14550 [Phaeobacter inhibens]